MNDQIIMVTILLFLAVVGLIAVAAMLAHAMSRDKRISSDLILKLTDRIVLSAEDQLARLNQESQERVAMHHIDAYANGSPVKNAAPVRQTADRTATFGTDNED